MKVSTPNFQEACDYVMEYGEHEGKTLYQILEIKPSYLDYITTHHNRTELQSYLKVFMAHDDVRRKIDEHIFGD